MSRPYLSTSRRRWNTTRALLIVLLTWACSGCAGSDSEPSDGETTTMGGDGQNTSSGDSNTSTQGDDTETSSTDVSTTEEDSTKGDTTDTSDTTTGAGGNSANPTTGLAAIDFNSTKVCSGSLCVTANLVSVAPICSGKLCVVQGRF